MLKFNTINNGDPVHWYGTVAAHSGHVRCKDVIERTIVIERSDGTIHQFKADQPRLFATLRQAVFDRAREKLANASREMAEAAVLFHQAGFNPYGDEMPEALVEAHG